MEVYVIIVLSFIALLVPSSLSSQNPKYDACSPTINCGSYGEIGYPFYGVSTDSTRPDYCGYFNISCRGSQQITISDQSYYVKSIDANADTITVYREDKWTSNCPDSLANTSIDFSKYKFTSDYQNITFFYDCIQSVGLPSPSLQVSCSLGGNGVKIGYYMTQKMMEVNKDLNLFQNCNSNINIPILQSTAEAIDATPTLGAVLAAFEMGFELGLVADTVHDCNECTGSGGECGYNSNSNSFICHCADDDYPIQCRDDSQAGKNQIRTVVAISAGIGVVILGLLILFSLYILRKCKPVPKNQRVEDFLKTYESGGPRRYTYANITKMTNSFREKLGEGGYGTVFKGKLQDGRAVAVKMWKQSKSDGHEFANEVLSISSTSHINVVPLLGFCFEGNKGALVYEFMPNGSLEKFIRGKDVKKNDQTLSIKKLFEIAGGIARGLEYLHRDCNTRIVHFDIKPHNILLDAEFTPKISDFGLAKAVKKKESIISISGARGTAGYIAPEVFFSSFGGASHKSDVYSYGMMVLEMVGCTKRPDRDVENSSELYFPRWIYKELERETTLDCSGRALLDEDKELERKMVLVGLWCIQTNPMSRPSSGRVLAMLEGEAELEVPPMPSLGSPPRQHQSIGDDSDPFLLSDAYIIPSAEISMSIK